MTGAPGRVLADLHLHSRHSRATSKDLGPESIHFWAALKGLGVVGTGDMTNHGWIKELSEKLVPGDDGLYGLRPDLAAAAALPA